MAKSKKEDKAILTCGLWEHRRLDMECVKVKCEDCLLDLTASAANLPVAKKLGMAILCLRCTLLRMKDEGSGEFCGTMRGGKFSSWRTQ